MIEELIEARSGSLKLTDWDAPGSSTAGGGDGGDGGGAGAASEPCQFTADLRKGVTAMHNVLQQQLPPEQLKVKLPSVVFPLAVFWACRSRSWNAIASVKPKSRRCRR